MFQQTSGNIKRSKERRTAQFLHMLCNWAFQTTYNSNSQKFQSSATYMCNKCKLKYNNLHNFKIHVRQQHTTIPELTSCQKNDKSRILQIFKCATCERCFPSKSDLLHHIKVIHKIERLNCKPHDDKSFVSF